VQFASVTIPILHISNGIPKQFSNSTVCPSFSYSYKLLLVFSHLKYFASAQVMVEFGQSEK
jgi:hypothetical protein